MARIEDLSTRLRLGIVGSTVVELLGWIGEPVLATGRVCDRDSLFNVQSALCAEESATSRRVADSQRSLGNASISRDADRSKSICLPLRSSSLSLTRAVQ